MDREYRQACEVTRLYALLSDAQEKIELLQTRISVLEAEVSALITLSQDYLRQLQRARASFWI